MNYLFMFMIAREYCYIKSCCNLFIASSHTYTLRYYLILFLEVISPSALLFMTDFDMGLLLMLAS